MVLLPEDAGAVVEDAKPPRSVGRKPDFTRPTSRPISRRVSVHSSPRQSVSAAGPGVHNGSPPRSVSHSGFDPCVRFASCRTLPIWVKQVLIPSVSRRRSSRPARANSSSKQRPGRAEFFALPLMGLQLYAHTPTRPYAVTPPPGLDS